jgi:hypothetical protein
MGCNAKKTNNEQNRSVRVQSLTVGEVHNIRYRGADKFLVRPTSRYILFDGENISFDASLVIYI